MDLQQIEQVHKQNNFSYRKFYTENICASMTDSMSGLYTIVDSTVYSVHCTQYSIVVSEVLLNLDISMFTIPLVM